MWYLSVRSRPVRRLLAVVLALSVLFTALGSTHAPCDVATATRGLDSHGAAVLAAAHAEMADTDGRAGRRGEGSHAAPSDGAPANGTGHERHDAPAALGCALVAHCQAAVVVTAATLAASEVSVTTLPLALRDMRPLEPSLQPDAPPPKG